MPEDFIRKKVRDDLDAGIIKKIHTRFPPEPNGFLHIGHAKSIVLNFSVAKEFGGTCNLRFDDTNPEREKGLFVDAIIDVVKWLGFSWEGEPKYTSNYFQQLYDYAVILIKKNLAYVDHSSAQEIKEQRGTPTQVGTNSQYRDRTIEENLSLFEDMRQGKFEDGTCLLRAKIDMQHPNITMRDPVIYRIKHQPHHNTGTTWCIYPMYDYAHCLSDAIEGITHSLCTLEFEVHRPLYDWFISHVHVQELHPQQIEFARLSISHTVLSKRKVKFLIDNKIVEGWDDPRLGTLAGLRRRGYTAQAVQNFCKEVGITKVNSTIEYNRLEESLRQDLNKRALRLMAVLDPIKLVIVNYPKEKEEIFSVSDNPEDEQSGVHEVPFSRVLYIEREDFNENPPSKYFRLSPGKEVRLKYAYYITCTHVIKDEQGNIQEIHAEYDPTTRGGWSEDGRKIKGTLHWVSVKHAVDIEIHHYEHLFTHDNPEQVDLQDIHKHINPRSFMHIHTVKAEPFIVQLHSFDNEFVPVPLQFLRKGYYILDAITSREKNALHFNYTVSLKERWRAN